MVFLADWLHGFGFYFWLTGLAYFAGGFIYAELLGYWYHRIFSHAILLRVVRDRKTPVPKVINYLFVPIRAAYYAHMWHHYSMFPEPNAPGLKEPKPFRPAHTFPNAAGTPENPWDITPTGNPRLDRLHAFVSRFGLRSPIDWQITGVLMLFLAYFVLGLTYAFAYFTLGMLVAGALNQWIHNSFHLLPYASLRQVPWKHWFQPDVAFANLGAHLPMFRRFYAYLSVLHVNHHFHVTPVDETNVLYHGKKLTASTKNFTMYTWFVDRLFGTLDAGPGTDPGKEKPVLILRD